MTKPTWLDVVKSVKAKHPEGTSLKDILPEASSLWKKIKSGKDTGAEIVVAPVKKATKTAKKAKKSKKAKKGKKGRKTMKGGSGMEEQQQQQQQGSEIQRIDLAQKEMYGGVNLAENVKRAPGLSLDQSGGEETAGGSLMQQEGAKQLELEGGMLEDSANMIGGKKAKKAKKTAKKAKKSKKAKKTAKKTAKKAKKSKKAKKTAKRK